MDRTVERGNSVYGLWITFRILADAQPVDLVHLRRARRPIAIMIPRDRYPVEVDHTFGKNRKPKQEFNYRGYSFRPGPRFAVKVPIKGTPETPIRIRMVVIEATESDYFLEYAGKGDPREWIWLDPRGGFRIP